MSRNIIEIMISCIICSRQPDIPVELKENIASTIGCEYEVIVIDNSKNEYSIFSAYNEGVRRAKGDVLCFMHEDILFHTEGWGEKISKILEDTTIGQIGVAGSHFMSKAPMYWWSSPYISQYNLETDNGVQKLNYTLDYSQGNLSDVVTVDGVCFFMRSDMFEVLRFDDVLYADFHAYDMDISMQVQNMGKRVCVTNEVLIEHFWSESSLQNQSYMARLDKNLKIFFDKWQHLLPMKRGVDIPDIVFNRMNNLSVQAYDAKMARRSKAYLLGKFLLCPNKINLTNLFKK